MPENFWSVAQQPTYPEKKQKNEEENKVNKKIASVDDGDVYVKRWTEAEKVAWESKSKSQKRNRRSKEKKKAMVAKIRNEKKAMVAKKCSVK